MPVMKVSTALLAAATAAGSAADGLTSAMASWAIAVTRPMNCLAVGESSVSWAAASASSWRALFSIRPLPSACNITSCANRPNGESDRVLASVTERRFSVSMAAMRIPIA
jgi:hypothetical protein